MNKISIITISFALMTLAFTTSTAQIHIVDDDPGFWQDFLTIQDAINASEDGDIIYVYNGTYVENVIVNQSVIILGNGTTNTTIDGRHTTCLKITAPNATIQGFEIFNSTSTDTYGIQVTAENTTISDVYCHNNYFGVFAQNTSRLHISNSTITLNTAYGIYLSETDNSTIHNNSCYSNDDGIVIKSHSRDNVIFNNTAYSHTPGQGIWIDSSSSFNMVFNNTAYENGEGGITLYNAVHHNEVFNNTVYSNVQSGIFIERDSYENWIYNNTVFNNSYGFKVLSSDNNSLEFNNISSSDNDGIYLSGSSENNLSNNSIWSNEQFGVYLKSSELNTISYNEIYNNTGYGVNCSSNAQDNQIHHNNFLYNGGSSSQAFDHTGLNIWHTSSEGNHWSDYSGTDDNGDGVGDTAYSIDGFNSAEDGYPLVYPVNTSSPRVIPEFPLLVGVLVALIGFVAEPQLRVVRRKRRSIDKSTNPNYCQNCMKRLPIATIPYQRHPGQMCECEASNF